MPDLFISYAHEDQQFVDQLHDALTSRDREVWLDRSRQVGEGIGPAEDWKFSATEAIDRSDALAFVMSDSSLASEPCLNELNHAATRRKRLLPVCLEEPADRSKIPEPIRDLRWIMMREKDDFDEGVAELLRALDTDIEIVRHHTRLLVRAKAWDMGQRRSSPLLRGDELRAAQDWLERAPVAGVTPLTLQREFIAASRRTAARRQRQVVSGSLTVAAIAIALAIFAFVQRAAARHQARVAQSRELAARAEAELGSDPEDAIALASRGVRIQDTPQAVHALGHALEASRLRTELRVTSPVDALAFSPDGTSVAIGTDDGAVRLIRVADNRRLWSEGSGELPVTGITFAKQGDILAVAHQSLTGGTGCSVEVLHTSTGALSHRLEATTSAYCDRFVGFLGATGVVAVGDQTGAVRLWNAHTGRPVGTVGGLRTPTGGNIAPGDGFTFTMGFRTDGHAIAAGGNDDVVRVVSVPGGRALATITGQNLLKPSQLAFSPNGNGLAIASRNATVVDTLSYGQANETADEVEQDVVRGVAWSLDGRLFADASGVVHVWATRSGRLVDDLGAGSASGFSALAFSPRGLLAGGSSDGTVRIWAPDPDLPIRQLKFSGDTLPYAAGAATRAHLTAVGDPSGAVAVTDDDGRLVRWLFPHGDGDSFAVTGDGALVFTKGGKLDLVGLRSGQLVSSSTLPVSAVTSLAASADARVLAVLSGKGMLAVRTNGAWREVRVPIDQQGAEAAPAIALSPDGRLLAGAGFRTSPVVTILGAPKLRPVHHEAGTAVAFSPSGGLVAIQRPDLSIAVLRIHDWHAQTVLLGAGPQATFAFSPDGRLLTAISQGTLRTWDVSDGTLLSTRYVIDDVAFSASNLTLSPPIITPAGVAVLGDPDTDTVDAFAACVGCLSPRSLLIEAHTRLHQIQVRNVS